MNKEDRVNLSKQIAELYGLRQRSAFYPLWIADDSARCFELMIEHEIDVLIAPQYAQADVGIHTMVREDFVDHNSKTEATRIAILKLMVKMKDKS